MKKFEVTFYFHTYGSVIVEAEDAEEALELADPSDIPNAELMANLVEDNDPDADEIKD